MNPALAALALAILPISAASAVTYRVALDERAPLRATVSLDLPPGRTAGLVLGITERSQPNLLGAPDCDGTPLVARAARQWSVPASCRTVHWAFGLRDQQKADLDASDPVGAWSAEGRWWLLTDHLAFLAPPGRWNEAEVAVTARFRDGRVKTDTRPFPHRGQMPYYAVISALPPRLYHGGGFILRVYGAVPFAAGDARQQFFADTWHRWRRDVLPVGAAAPAVLDILWVPPPPHAEAAFMASAGMRAVLMQYIPGQNRAASDAKLRAALLLGTHEGFHTLIGSVPETWPMWVNESWASYFAWRAAEPHLDPAALKVMKTLIDAPTPLSLLAIETQVEQGDDSNYQGFYGKGARFWAAIDTVLVTRRNPSGRLAALIQDTHGLQGLDWSSAATIAAYLNARSDGRAGAIVQCYLVARDCG